MKLAIIFNKDKLSGKLTKLVMQLSLLVEKYSFFVLSYQPIGSCLARNSHRYLFGQLKAHQELRPCQKETTQTNSSISHKPLFLCRRNICNSKHWNYGNEFSLQPIFYKFLIFFRLLNDHVSKLLTLILRRDCLLFLSRTFRKIFDLQTLAMKICHKPLLRSRTNIPTSIEGQLSCRFSDGLVESQSKSQTFGHLNHLLGQVANSHNFLMISTYQTCKRFLFRIRTLLTTLVPCIQIHLHNLQPASKRSLSHIFYQYDLQNFSYENIISGKKLCQ